MPSSPVDAADQPALRAVQRGPVEDGPAIGRTYTYPGGAREETSLLAFINVLLRYRRLLIVCALAGALILGLIAARSNQTYVALASFTVRGLRTRTPISELAAQLSLASPSDPSQSAAFYVDLISSNAILEPVAGAPYTIQTSSGSSPRSLASIYGIEEKSPSVALLQSVAVLRSQLSASGNGRTGVIRVSVRAPSPQLGQQILQNVLQSMESYNASQQRRQATAERDFVERMLNDAGVALNQAEARLSVFRELNREYASSPMLTLENDRLARGVRMRQQIYTTMTQSLEQAKIEELRDLPAITVLDRPESAATPDSRFAMQRMLLGMIAGLMVGIVLAFLRIRWLEIRHAGTPAYREYSALKEETVASLARPWRNKLRSGG